MPVTLSTARTRAARRIGDSSQNFYTSALYNDIIEQRCISWAGLIARLCPHFYLEHTSFTGVDDAADANYEFYTFPSNYRTFVQLERQFGSGAGRVYQPLRVINSEDQDRFRLNDVGLLTLSDSLTNYEPTVSVWGNQLRIIPAPVNNSYEYRLKYLRRPVTLSADESTLDVPDEWVELIVLDTAYQVLSQLGDVDSARMLQGNLDREIKMMKDEFRRQSMNIEGGVYLDQMGF